LEAQQAELEQQTEELEVANEELIESREVAETARLHVSGILGAITDAFVVHDREWRFQYINDAAAQVFKSAGTGTAESIAGRLLWDLYPDIVGTGFEREMRRAQRDRVPVIFEQFYARRGRWTELHCYPMPDGGLATLWKDITEKKRAEERLRYVSQASAVLASSLDYRTTIAKLAELLVPELADWCGVQLADEHGTLQQLAVAHVDPTKVQWARELNARYPVDMSATTGAPQVLRSGVSELYGEITDEMLAAGAKDAEHLRILRDLGMTSALVVPLAARGRVIGVMSLISAESGRRYTDAEQALAEELAGRAAMAIDNSRLYTDAQEANRAKADFLAHMSHELRTPLNAIAGYAELMELGVHGPLTGEQFQDVLRIKRSQRHLLGLINDVLNFAKLEAGHVGYDLAPFVVRELVAQLEVLIAPQLAAKSLRYDIADIPAELVAHGDAERVQQILLNLLSNATKFTAAGGRIRVSARRDGEMLWIEVSDTGTGIATDKWNVVFEPFVQLERTFSSSH
ncbi:MAG TPA: histidine kinase dimerization/phospho-acceptor domain-containing protein, partial [Gammaproteobacteria bacterium]|nr:histidine kinase dimerization/phospho-acceptor domain-containing protein [Gammaproteobacteria bacterium]